MHKDTYAERHELSRQAALLQALDQIDGQARDLPTLSHAKPRQIADDRAVAMSSSSHLNPGLKPLPNGIELSVPRLLRPGVAIERVGDQQLGIADKDASLVAVRMLECDMRRDTETRRQGLRACSA